MTRRPSIQQILLTCSIAGMMLFWACKSKNNPVEPQDPQDPPKSDNVIESKQASVGPSGGTVALGGGAMIVVPPGALTQSTTITLNQLNPTQYFASDVSSRVVLGCSTSGIPFSQDVAIKVPIPAGVSLADSLSFLAGKIDSTGAIQIYDAGVELSGNTGMLVVRTRTFSDWVFEFLKRPPASTILDIPYYNQGETSYCWATVIQMVSEAANHDPFAEIFSIIGQMGVDESGIISASFRYSSTLAKIIHYRTGAAPERTIWHSLELARYRLPDYMRREIGLRGHPIALHSSGSNHAYVIVGYDANHFYVHDPQETNIDNIAAQPWTWEQFMGKMGVLDQFVTLVIPKPLAADRPLVTINLVHGSGPLSSIYFKTGVPQSDFLTFKWDYARSEGYSLYSSRQNKAMTPLPWSVTEQKVKLIEIANATNTATTVTASYDITRKRDSKIMYLVSKQVNVPARGMRSVEFDPIDVRLFRDSTQTVNTEYIFSARVLSGGTVSDEAQFSFVMEPGLAISSLSPTSGDSGTEFTIMGTSFGSSQGSSSVKLGGNAVTNILSWSTTQIRAKVPSGAASGGVVVTVEGIQSNTALFSVVGTPIITSIIPPVARVDSLVMIAGKSFRQMAPGNTVMFGQTLATSIPLWRDTLIQVAVPRGATTGNVVITVDGIKTNGFAFKVKPYITSVDPAAGLVGTPFTVRGESFGNTQGGSTLVINNLSATVTSWADTLIRGQVASGMTSGNLVVTVSGVSSNTVPFSVATSLVKITGVSSVLEHPYVGERIAVLGSGFGSTRGTSTVVFNGVPATEYGDWSDQQISVTIPLEAAKGSMVVIVNGQTSNAFDLDIQTILDLLHRCNAVEILVMTKTVTTTGGNGGGVSIRETNTPLRNLVWSGTSFTASYFSETLTQSYDTRKIDIQIHGSVSGNGRESGQADGSYHNSLKRGDTFIEKDERSVTIGSGIPLVSWSPVNVFFRLKGSNAGSIVQSMAWKKMWSWGAYSEDFVQAEWSADSEVQLNFTVRN